MPKEKTLLQLIEDAEDKIAETQHCLQKIKEKIEDEEEMDEFERHLP